MVKGKKVKSSNKKIVVIYHGDCPDGFSGAWAAWKKFGNKAEYIGASDRANPPKGLAGKEVYFIDWVYPLATMKKVQRAAGKVIAIDHHATTETASRAMDECVFDMHHSGAVLAWRYFHPKKLLPKLFRYVEDHDLGRFKLAHTKAIGAFLALVPFGFSSWSQLVFEVERVKLKNKIVTQGQLIIKYEKKLIAEIAANARKVVFEKRKALAVNSPVLSSELGHYLSVKHPPFAIIWRERKDGSTRVSLRSVNNFNIGRYAQKYGGGGHRNSAGFSIPAGKRFPWKPIRPHTQKTSTLRLRRNNKKSS